MGMHIIDLLVLLVYFLGITAIGVWAARRIKTRCSMPLGIQVTPAMVS